MSRVGADGRPGTPVARRAPRRFGFRMSALLAALLFLPPSLMLSSAPDTASASVGAIFPVTQTSDKHQSPAIGGRLVVWEDDRDGASNIRARNLDTGTEFAVATGTSVKRDPATNGRFVFWEDKRNGASDIYGYQISTATEFPLAGGPRDQRKPEIAGNKVVWEGKNAEGRWQIHSVNLTSYEPSPARPPASKLEATGGDTRMNPVISDQFIAWEETRGGVAGIYAKDRKSGREMKVAGGFSVSAPAVSGSTVVWQTSDSGTFDAFGRDLRAKNLKTGGTFTVAGGSGDQVAPAISGKLVVWQSGPNDVANIYGRDLETGEIFLIAGGDARPHTSPDISGETVVWQNERLSQTIQPDGSVTTNLHLDILGAELDVPPAAPKALAATGSLDGVALKWTANTERDLVGYNVYRSDSAGGAYTRLNAAPVSSPSYTDAQAPRGAKSYYRVTAVDDTGKESVEARASSAAHVLSELGLSAGASLINAGDSLRLTGRLSSGGNGLSGKTVELFERPAGAGGWRKTVRQPAPTGADGGFSVSGVKPAETTEYRARFAGELENGFRAATSPVRQVKVKRYAALSLQPSRGTLVAGQELALSGRLAAGGKALPGERVVLLRKPAGAQRFARVPGQPTAGVLTGPAGGYRLGGIQPRKNTLYQAIFRGGPELHAATSAIQRVNVRARVTTSVNVSNPLTSIRGKVVTAENGTVTVTVKKDGRVVASKKVKLVDSRYRTFYRPPGKGEYTVTASFARDSDNLGNVGPARVFSRR